MGEEVRQGDLLGVDKEGVVADGQIMQGEGFAIQDVFGIGFFDGSELEIPMLGLYPFLPFL